MPSPQTRPKGAPRKPTAAELFVMPRSILSLFAAPAMGRLTNLFPRWLSAKLEGEAGLTGPRVMLMWLLSRWSEPTMGEVSQMLDLTPRAITRLMDGLEEEGLAERLPDPNDGRVFKVRLTRAGTRRFKELEPRLQGEFVSLFAGLEKQEIRELIRLVEKLSDTMIAQIEQR